jgi:hypothetical protein
MIRRAEIDGCTVDLYRGAVRYTVNLYLLSPKLLWNFGGSC